MNTPTKTAPKPRKQTPLETAMELIGRYAQLEKHVAETDEAMKPVKTEMAEIKTKLQEWAEQNKPAFDGKKTLGLGAATFGYKAGPRKLVLPLDLNLPWYVSTVEQALPTAVKKEVDTKLLISGLDHNPDLQKVLRRRGVEVKQEDYFYISIKK